MATGLIRSFKDKDGIQIMKDFMASGSFSRGKDIVNANAAMVFIGNLNQSVDTLVKTSHLLAPFPEVMIDAAFFDRFHNYIPGWEIPKMKPEFFTKGSQGFRPTPLMSILTFPYFNGWLYPLHTSIHESPALRFTIHA
jgi:predicted ATP-dependent Lon-type protease